MLLGVPDSKRRSNSVRVLALLAPPNLDGQQTSCASPTLRQMRHRTGHNLVFRLPACRQYTPRFPIDAETPIARLRTA